MELNNLYDNINVIELTIDDFIIKKNKVKVNNKLFKDRYGLIVFYAPWCGHCKNMKEMWIDLAIQFKYKFIIGAVNCENKKNDKLCSEVKIKYFPTIKFITKNGELHNYDESMDKDDFIYFICSKI